MYLRKNGAFQGLTINKLETEWAEYLVFHIDFNGSNLRKQK